MNFLRHIPRWFPTVLVTAAILYATLAPHPVGADKLPLFPGVDKLIHFLMFAALASALLFDLQQGDKNRGNYRRLTVVAVICTLFGAVDELLQSWLTTARSGDWLDWLADITGIAATLLIYRSLCGRHRP